jgi:hypothetical protein
VFEFCVCSTYEPHDVPHVTGDHAWLQLKTPDGKIYNVGPYRDAKTGTIDNWILPLRLKNAYLMSPDVSEFWPCKIWRLGFEITEAQFFEMVKKIESDKAKDQETFQLFQHNCLMWVESVARIGGIQLDTADSVLRLFIPRKWKPYVDAVVGVLPTIVKKVLCVISAFFVNCILLAFGAGVIDKKVKALGVNVLPHISTPLDMFRFSKTILHHPFSFVEKTYEEVMRWREEERERIRQKAPMDMALQLEQVDFRFPDTCRINK